jgi:alginate O-acetyltransferase complex protein AlgJ
MSDQEEPPIGNEPPLKPERSLPSYREPTPETHRKFSRETEAELALKHTLFAPGTAALLVLFFLITIAAVPIIQFAAEFRAVHSIGRLPTFAAFSALIPRADSHPIHSIVDLGRIFPKADEIKSVQKTLESESVIAQWLLPRVESVLTGKLHAGNEQVYLGRNNWLFYRPDVDYVIGPPFLDPFWIKRRRYSAGVQPDAVRAIVDFRNQLARRGIDLVVIPTPVKPTVDGGMLAPSTGETVFENESFKQFKTRLEREGVGIFDPELLLTGNKIANLSPMYLEADTHWRPETMETVAQQLAYRIGVSRSASPFQIVDKKIKGLGDVARMLKLPPDQLARYAEEITIHQVAAGNARWRLSKNADVLLLGDSFSNIFSLDDLGWGESAGFAEHLSRALGRPIDCILRNSDGAFATREILNHELAGGRDRLAGKKMVVWQFATRELAFGNWKLLDMTLRASAPARFFTPQLGEEIVVTGTVEAISAVPRPGSAPYADHIMTVHLVDLSGPPQRDNQPFQCLVYLWSMRDYAWTPAAHLRPGDRVRLRLRPWSDVSAEYEKINRSEIDDAALQLEEPVWGEFAN